MSTLRITRGYPASGKTTLARQWVAQSPESRARVNRDDLRASMYDRAGVLTFSQEQQITKAEQGQVSALLAAGLDVIVDDTNLRLKFARAWADLAQAAGAEFEVVDVKTDVDECIKRDDARMLAGQRYVGDKVIRELAAKFPIARWPKVETTLPSSPPAKGYLPDVDLPEAWIVDIDGTLANHHGIRDPYDTSLYHLDRVHEPIRALVRMIFNLDAIIVTSGRSDEFRAVTEKWLRDNEIPYDQLIMRKAGDNRPDYIVKSELFWKHIAPKWNIRGVIDDRDQVVAMWRAMGLVCLQAAPGNF